MKYFKTETAIRLYVVLYFVIVLSYCHNIYLAMGMSIGAVIFSEVVIMMFAAIPIYLGYAFGKKQ